jgi:pyridoxine 5-phosphate synthase
MSKSSLRLGVNIDHVATLRNARGGAHPCPIAAAQLAADAGADGITAHLREDRRHIRDADMRRLKAEVALPLNFEMAATIEMQALALEILPNACCLVPEKREERTTEGGLDVASNSQFIQTFIQPLKAAGIRVSLFIDPDLAQVEAAAKVGADIVELHTGTYAELSLPQRGMAGVGAFDGESRLHNSDAFPLNGPLLTSPLGGEELGKLQSAATLAHSLGLEVHAGHGLTFENVGAVAAIPELVELNIGHFIIGEAVFMGLDIAILEMRRAMIEARAKA